MITQWMLGAVAFALLCGVAALAAERALLALRRETRLVWAIALLVGATWPVIARVMLATPAESVGARVAPAIVITGAPAVTSEPWLSALWLGRIDLIAMSLWIGASAFLLLQVAMALRTLRRVKRQAQPIDVDGEPVLIDDTLGPAVIGLVAPTIVIPAWLLDVDDELRALVLRHEREHRRVHDPALVWLSVIATTLLPWNVALWWMSRRLRLSMEIDCDARTVQVADDRTRYAKLLLLIAQRKSSARFVPMLSDSQSQLGRRISAMHSEPVRHPALRAAIAGGVVALAVTAACSSRMATNLTSPTPTLNSNASAMGAAVEVTTSSATTADSVSGDHMPRMLPGSTGLKYPPALFAAKVSGGVLAQYVVNADGLVDTATVKVLRSADPAFTSSVREALPVLRYDPARKDGKAVRGFVQQNFVFEISTRGEGILLAPPGPPPGFRVAQGSPTPNPEGKPYFDFQVERPARIRAGARGPVYPQQLRDARTEGVVLAQFVVDTTGRVDMTTFKVLKSDNGLFTDAVRAALVDMQFDAALVGGRPVKQLLQQPFEFNLNGR